MYKLLVLVLAVAVCEAGVLLSFTDKLRAGAVKVEQKLGLEPKNEAPVEAQPIPKIPPPPYSSNEPGQQFYAFADKSLGLRLPNQPPPPAPALLPARQFYVVDKPGVTRSDLLANVQTDGNDYQPPAKRPGRPDLEANIKTDGKVTTNRPMPTRSDLVANVQTDDDDENDQDTDGQPEEKDDAKAAYDPNNRSQITAAVRCAPGELYADGECRTTD